MVITYLGHSCFRIKGKKKTIICDPFTKDAVGFIMPKTRADMVLITHHDQDHSALDRLEGEYFVVNGPGEYEVGGVFVYGIQTDQGVVEKEKFVKNSIYIVTIDGFRFCHLGGLGSALTEKIIDEIDGVDVLFIPVGGYQTIELKAAISLIEKIEPKIVIPMLYATKQHRPEFQQTRGTLADLMKQWDKEAQTKEKLDLKKFPLTEDTQLVVLKPKK